MKRIVLLVTLLLTVGLHAFAQTRNVTGKIQDENGQGYPGAGITVKGTQIGTVSDVNGDFTLEVPDGKNTFVIQAVGYGTKTVTDEGASIVVKLQPTAKQLEGSVVTALAFKREKRELGYATTTLNNDELTSGQNTSAISGLAGKVAGANITSSTGGPGGSTRIVLRGEKSILKNNNALIVIDGVIINNYDRTQDASGLAQVDFGNSANDIDPDEIESMSVLEGPAAAALYGAAGANGAIMITTKAGKRNPSKDGKASKMDITYKASYTQSDILKYADVQHQFGQGNLYGGVADDRRENFSWGYQFDGHLRPWGQIIDGKQLVKPYSDQPNNIKSFFNHGKDLNNFVSVSGGTETSTYYLSLSSVNSTGLVPNTFYNKYSVRFNGTTQLSNNFYSGINLNYINTYSRAENSGQGTGSVVDALYEVARDIPIWELKNYNDPSHFYSMQYYDKDGIERYGYYGAYYKNPYWVAKNYDNRNKSDRVLGDFKVGYKKGDFNVYDRAGVDVTADRSRYNTPVLNSQPTESPFYDGLTYTNSGGYSQNSYNGFRFTNDLIFTFTHQLSSNFGMNATAGHNMSMSSDESLTGTIDPGTNGLVIPNYYSLTNNKGPVAASNTLTQRRVVGVYADLTFNYQRELFLEVTGRNDWSSSLISGHNSYFYPSLNASWVFTERMKGPVKDKVLNYGKVRFGVAGVGNDAIPYANNNAGYSQSAISSGFGSIVPPFNGVPAYQINGTFGDNKLKPEQTRSYEVGTDLSFFKDRLSTSFTYYYSLTHDLITAVPVPTSSGYNFSYVNVGSISNRGIELSMRGAPISTKYGLKWELFGTLSKNKSNVESLTGGVDNVVLGGYSGMSITAAVGRPYGTFYAADISYEKDPATGKWHAIVDKNTGLPVATSKPVYKGTYNPDFIASWGTDLTYKGLKLHVLFTTKQGGQFYSRNKSNMDFNGTSVESTINNRNPLVWANSVNNIAPAGATPIYQTNTTKYSPYDYYVNDAPQNLPAQNLINATYIKLQELALSYKIPAKYYSKSPFGSLEAGIFGNNLIIWTAKSNQYDDPEETSSGAAGNAQGFNYTARPSMRNYGGYIKVTF